MKHNPIKPFARSSSLLAAFALSAFSALAQNVTLTDGNSVATVNLGAAGGGTGAAGMNSWTINTQNQLQQQWFWFRVGSGSQSSLDALGTPSYSHIGNVLDATYSGTGFNINIIYVLNGGATGGSDWNSDITESISIANTSSSSPLDFHFFQYSDFQLAGTHGGSSVQILQNGDGFFTQATVIKGANQLAETITQPLADHAEAGVTTDSPMNTLDRLNGLNDLQLDGTLSAGVDPMGGDATWALEWDRTINPNSSQDILKDKKLSVAPVPEPASIAILSLGLGAFILRRSRRLV